MTMLQNANAIEVGGYTVNNSLRFRSSASSYLSRTPASAGDRQKWTWSAWIKRGSTIGGASNVLFNCYNTTSTTQSGISIDSDNLVVFSNDSSTVNINLVTSQVFRDPSAWYHFVVSVDTTQATASNRIKVYVNGSQVTAFGTSTYPSQNYNTHINTTSLHTIFATRTPSGLTDGYLADVNFIDGSAKTPSDFGETDTTTGVWKPKAYTGTYGTNGFYLKFSDIATTSGSNAGLGKDFSGNTNYWTTNNISVTSGTTYDAMIDSPTNATSGTRPVGNYCVLNPLNKDTSITVTNANLSGSAGGTNIGVTGSIAISSGKWYWEVTQTAGGVATSNIVGITDSTLSAKTAGLTTNSYGYGTGTTAYKWNAGTNTAYGVNWTNGDVISVAFDADAGTLIFYKNGTSQGTAFTGISGSFYPAFGFQNTSAYDVNFGQRPFAYSVPSGYKALCTTNLPDSTIVKGNKYMDATLYTGNGASSRSITNAASFRPDFVWIKQRSSTEQHQAFDSVRGATKVLNPNQTTAETTDVTKLTAFNSDGFSIGSELAVNANGSTYVGWQWQAGSSTVTNTSGSISAQVRANTTTGFSIVTYTGNGTSGATIGHGLGVAPKMMIIKKRSAAGDNWRVYHASLGATKFLDLNQTSSVGTATSVWNDTAPTSTVWTVGTNGEVNTSTATYVGYCFAEIAGFSKFGSYTGNGSADGPFVYCGFLPRWVLIKQSSSAGNSWQLIDTARETTNPDDTVLFPNLSNAEGTGNATLDFLSNGFKVRTTDGTVNTSTSTYIFAAFAENPFSVNCRAR